MISGLKPLALPRTEASEILAVGVIATLFIAYVVSIVAKLSGPFVFGDEAEYASMAQRALAGDFLFGEHAQYGPLFPLLLALLRLLGAPSLHVAALIINFSCWAGCVALAFRLAALLGLSKLERRLAMLLMLLAPFWTFTFVTWAEPLFFMLQYAAFVFLVRDLQQPWLGNRAGLGLSLGLMFLAKPIGLFYLPPLLVAYALAEMQKTWKSDRQLRLPLLQLVQIAFFAALLFLPWMIRNYLTGGALLGYGYASKMLNEMIQREGVLSTFIAHLYGLAYQLSYVIFLSFGFFAIVTYGTAKLRGRLEPEVLALSVFVVLSILAVCAISDVHMTPFPTLGYWIPNGRYVTQFGPVLVLLAIVLIRQLAANHSEGLVRDTTLLFAIQVAWVLLASPVKVLSPYGLVNTPDLGLMYVSEFVQLGTGFVWHSLPYVPDRYQLTISALLMLPSLLAVLMAARKLRSTAILVLLIALTCAGTSIEFNRIWWTQYSQSPLNELFRKVPGMCSQHVYFDKRLTANEAFVHRYWCGGEPKTATLDDFVSLSETGTRQAPLFVTGRSLFSANDQLRQTYQNVAYVILSRK